MARDDREDVVLSAGHLYAAALQGAEDEEV
jgi:hypothetical protein